MNRNISIGYRGRMVNWMRFPKERNRGMVGFWIRGRTTLDLIGALILAGKYHEEFEICEFGRQPADEEIKMMFPMTGK